MTILDALLDLALPERRSAIAAHASRVLATQAAPWMTTCALVDLATALDVEGPLHTARVARLARRTGMVLGLAPDVLETCELGAWLHDVGKIAVPDDVLHKPGLYDDDDWRKLRVHSAIGARILEGARGLEGALEIVLAHHEHHDGNGYPRALAGDAIPIGARLFTVVDSYDAMTRMGREREWGDPCSHDAALRELRSLAGTRYDPVAVDAFERAMLG